MKGTTIFVIAVLVVSSNQNSRTDYYWREFLGPIPPDAVVGGKNADGTVAYIGQGYYRNHDVTPEVQIMTVFRGQENNLTEFNNILCGPQNKLYWMKVNASQLYMQLGYKHFVIGGHDGDIGYLGIGRVILNGTVNIEKVVFSRDGDALMYFSNGPYEKDVSNYEILIYNDDATTSATDSTKKVYLYIVLIFYVLLTIIMK